MLVLSRKKNESIVAGPPGRFAELVITVVEIRGDKIRLGLEAPRDWGIHRQEVWTQLQKQTQETQDSASKPAAS